MTPDVAAGLRAIEKLEYIRRHNSDVEEAHREADTVLCDLLKELGLNDVVEEWEKVRKWYA